MFTTLDRSNYLKALLILARQDRRLVDQEKEIIRNVAQKFGFSRDFYEDVLKGLMANKYITEDPVTFSNKEVAHSFLVEGFSLAGSDKELHEKEVKWLHQIASANDISDEEFNSMLSTYKQVNHFGSESIN